MPRLPRGVPSVTYCRIVPEDKPQRTSNDLMSDGNCITLVDTSSEGSDRVQRYEVSRCLERGYNDEEICELTIGGKAGDGVGAAVCITAHSLTHPLAYLTLSLYTPAESSKSLGV